MRFCALKKYRKMFPSGSAVVLVHCLLQSGKVCLELPSTLACFVAIAVGTYTYGCTYTSVSKLAHVSFFFPVARADFI